MSYGLHSLMTANPAAHPLRSTEAIMAKSLAIELKLLRAVRAIQDSDSPLLVAEDALGLCRPDPGAPPTTFVHALVTPVAVGKLPDQKKHITLARVKALNRQILSSLSSANSSLGAPGLVFVDMPLVPGLHDWATTTDGMHYDAPFSEATAAAAIVAAIRAQANSSSQCECWTHLPHAANCSLK